MQRTGLTPRLVEQSRTLARRLFDERGLPLPPVLAESLGRRRVSWSAAVRVAAARKKTAPEALARLGRR